VIAQHGRHLGLIIVTANPLTYALMRWWTALRHG